MKPSISDMMPVCSLKDPELVELARQARNYLTCKPWCCSVCEAYLAFGIGGVIGVFLFTIDSVESGMDDTLWVVVGDLPPAYLVCDDAPDWRGALDGYIYEMRRWIAAVRCGSSLDDVIPVAAAPTIEHASMLETRLDFIQRRFIDDASIEIDRS
jgi:hypothetical protein